MKRMSNLWQLTAADLAAAIASKKVSCTEVVEAHLRRIEAVNPRVNAVVKVLGDEARRDAAEADRKLASGAALVPLHGVPFTIKENIDVAGCATCVRIAGNCIRALVSNISGGQNQQLGSERLTDPFAKCL